MGNARCIARAGRWVSSAALLLSTTLLLADSASAEARCGEVPGDTEGLQTAWQLIESTCGCVSAPSDDWKKEYREFLGCARGVMTQAVANGTIRRKCRGALFTGVRRSTCARPNTWATCCITNKRSQTTCKTRKHPDQCATRNSRFAELGETETCLDACVNASGPLCWHDSECDDGQGCTIDWCEPSDGCHNVAVEGCTPGTGGVSCTGTGAPTHGTSAYEVTVIELINQHRASRGRAPVEICASLSRASQDHANDLRDQGYFSHVGQNGSAFWERACDAGYQAGCGPTTSMGEIIASVSALPSGAMWQWLNSSGHESIILGSNYVVAGIGHACGGPRSNYWVVNFAATNEPSCG